MSLPIRFRDDALGEFDAAASWYEERLSGLGVEFVAEVQRVLNSIGLQPDRFPTVYRDVREARAKRFPYCVYFRLRSNQIVVIAVFHTSRNPTIWQSRA